MTKLPFVYGTLWDRFLVGLLGKAIDTGPDPLLILIYILGGAMFGVLVLGLIFLLVRYFVQWAYEEIYIKRGRDSLAELKARASHRAKPRERTPSDRRRRKLVPGIRRRA